MRVRPFLGPVAHRHVRAERVAGLLDHRGPGRLQGRHHQGVQRDAAEAGAGRRSSR